MQNILPNFVLTNCVIDIVTGARQRNKFLDEINITGFVLQNSKSEEVLIKEIESKYSITSGKSLLYYIYEKLNYSFVNLTMRLTVDELFNIKNCSKVKADGSNVTIVNVADITYNKVSLLTLMKRKDIRLREIKGKKISEIINMHDPRVDLLLPENFLRTHWNPIVESNIKSVKQNIDSSLTSNIKPASLQSSGVKKVKFSKQSSLLGETPVDSQKRGVKKIKLNTSFEFIKNVSDNIVNNISKTTIEPPKISSVTSTSIVSVHDDTKVDIFKDILSRINNDTEASPTKKLENTGITDWSIQTLPDVKKVHTKVKKPLTLIERLWRMKSKQEAEAKQAALLKQAETDQETEQKKELNEQEQHKQEDSEKATLQETSKTQRHQSDSDKKANEKATVNDTCLSNEQYTEQKEIKTGICKNLMDNEKNQVSYSYKNNESIKNVNFSKPSDKNTKTQFTGMKELSYNIISKNEKIQQKQEKAKKRDYSISKQLKEENQYILPIKQTNRKTKETFSNQTKRNVTLLTLKTSDNNINNKTKKNLSDSIKNKIDQSDSTIVNKKAKRGITKSTQSDGKVDTVEKTSGRSVNKHINTEPIKKRVKMKDIVIKKEDTKKNKTNILTTKKEKLEMKSSSQLLLVSQTDENKLSVKKTHQHSIHSSSQKAEANVHPVLMAFSKQSAQLLAEKQDIQNPIESASQQVFQTHCESLSESTSQRRHQKEKRGGSANSFKKIKINSQKKTCFLKQRNRKQKKNLVNKTNV
ncbi:hypothetical protein CDIK_2075 [Cucumispora dikerogammari]|nr:hypothetical protein CDIK_2075 [Cucumispora dikerogammari]